MSEQTLKGKARQTAPETGKAAIAEARGTLKKGSRVQPVYKTQEKIGGKNIHREVDEIISEFDDPAANKV